MVASFQREIPRYQVLVASAYDTSTCVTVANFSLAKTSHMGKPRFLWGRELPMNLVPDGTHRCSHLPQPEKNAWYGRLVDLFIGTLDSKKSDLGNTVVSKGHDQLSTLLPRSFPAFS